MGLIGELVVKITGNTAALDRSIDRTEAKLKKLSQSAVALGRKLTLGLTLPIVALGAAFVKAASNAEETQSKFNVVFRDQAEEVNKWAETFSKAVGRGVTENKRFLAGVQDLFVPLGFARTEATKMSKSVVQLATDLGSFNDVPTADVVRDIQGGLVGMHIAVRKYGILLNEATISQELLNMGLVGGFRAATDMQKVQARLNLIMKGSADAAGDAERTIESFANQMRALQGDAMDLSESLGALLIPVLKDIITTLRGWINDFNDLDDETKKFILTVAALLAALGPAIFIFGKLIALGIAMKNAFLALRTAFIATKVAMLALSSALIANPIGLLIAGVALLAVGIGALVIATRKQVAVERDLNKELKERTEHMENLKRLTGSSRADKLVVELLEKTKPLLAERKILEEELLVIKDKEWDAIRRNDKAGIRAAQNERQNTLDKIAGINAEIAALNRKAMVIDADARKGEEAAEDEIELKRMTFEASEQMISDHLSFASSAEAARAKLAKDAEEIIRAESEKTAAVRQQLMQDFLATAISIAGSLAGIWGNFFSWQASQADLTDKERRKIQHDAAVASKAFATFQVILTTAMSIQSALASIPPNVPLAVLNAVSGAAQLAKVLSTPLPKLGRGGVALGPSIVGDAGPEVALPLTDEIFARLAGAIENARAPDIINQITPSDNRAIDLNVGVNIDGRQLNAYITGESRNGRIIVDKNRGITK